LVKGNAVKVDPETGIWDVELGKRRHKTDVSLAEVIGSSFPVPWSMADVGCGFGEYCKIFRDKFNWPIVIGFEGTPLEEVKEAFRPISRCDLTKPDALPDRMFDIVLCLEVGEHIPRKHEQVFLTNVCSRVLGVLILSWAPPEQGGTGHVNGRPRNYVIRQVEDRGLCLDIEKTKTISEKASFGYFKRNVMVFRRY
jgi:SAM-dependent methyltransferase